MKNLLTGATANPWREAPASTGATPATPDVKELQVNVAFTTPKGTLAALHEAARLTAGLRGSIRVIVPRIVPYPLELNHPQVSPEFMADRFRSLSTTAGIDLQFEIVLCRETAHAYTVALEHNSLIIVGGCKRWWPSKETKLVRALTCKGHTVLFVNSEKA